MDTEKTNREQSFSLGAQSGARLACVQALFTMHLTGQGLEASKRAFKRGELGLDNDGNMVEPIDPETFEEILKSVVTHQTQIDNTIQSSLKKGWSMGRLDGVSIAILRAATAELLTHRNLDTSIILSEYVSLAYTFFDSPEPQFINGCLQTLSDELRN